MMEKFWGWWGRTWFEHWFNSDWCFNIGGTYKTCQFGISIGLENSITIGLIHIELAKY